MLTHFFIYGILGWTLEVFWTGLGSLSLGNWQLPGFTYLWMFPIYGLAAFMEPLHDRIADLPWYIRGLLWMTLIFAIEYATGSLLCFILGNCPWDYRVSTPYHINGLIRVDFAPAWFVVGLLFEKIHHMLDKIRV